MDLIHRENNMKISLGTEQLSAASFAAGQVDTDYSCPPGGGWAGNPQQGRFEGKGETRLGWQVLPDK